MANFGTGIIDFGAGPIGKDLATLVITGQTGILSTSSVDAWLTATPTIDHTLTDHIIESLDVMAGNIVAGTGLTIYARTRNTGQRGKYTICWAWV